MSAKQTVAAARPRIKVLLVGSFEEQYNFMHFATAGFVPQPYLSMTFANFTYKLNMDSVEYELGLWDTIGQHDCDRLRPFSYPKPDVVLVGFATNDPDSLDNVRENWITEIRHWLPTAPMVLVGYNLELKEDAEVMQILNNVDIKI